MKKTLFVIGWLLIGYSGFSQGDEYYGNYQHYYEQSEIIENPTIQPPEAAAFQKVNFIPVSNYTGRANISIPIYTIKSGNITVPISLSYNTGGVKVNDIPSSVGSNWSLNASGVVSKIVRGMDDFSKYDNLSGFDTSTWSYHASPTGWLYRKYHEPKYWGNLIDWADQNDPLPDLYIVSAPGLSTQYTHTIATDAPYNGNGQNGTGGDVFELTGQKNVITETIGDTNIYGSFTVSQQIPNTNNWQYIDGSFNANKTLFYASSIKVTSLSGLEYAFNDFDVSQYTFSEQSRDAQQPGTYGPVKIKSNLKAEAYNLTYIKDLKTNKEVHFYYETYYKSSYDAIDDTYFYYGSTTPFYMDAIVDAKSVKYPQLHRLTKITYDTGSVEFVYGLNRLDVSGEKALTQIIIKDINGNVVTNYNLTYGYMQSPYFTTTPQSKRLRLDNVYTTNAAGDALPGYTMTYNATALPARGTWGQDFLGYNNGTYSSSNTNPKPNIYFYPDSGINSFLPINKGSGYYLLSGNYSLASNLTYAKAGILEKIQYPSGGSSVLEYESNQFKVDNTTIAGGGLRVKTQKIIDENANEQLLDYEYKLTDNSSSGSIVSFSNYVDFKVTNTYTAPLYPPSALSYFSFKTYRFSQAQAELTKGSFVGYSRVVVKDRVSNGYTEYNYTSPSDYPNGLSTRTPYYYPTSLQAIEQIAINNGKHNFTINKEIYRGNLLSKSVYSKTNTLLLKEENTYTYKSFTGFNYNHKMQLSNAQAYYGSYGEYTGPQMLEDVSIYAERNLVSQTVTTHYLDGGQTSVTSQITYDANYPLVKENTINDGLKTVLNKYFYPHNAVVSSLPYMANVRTQNRYSEMIRSLSR